MKEDPDKMSEKRIIDMMQRIDSYVRGRLNQKQIEALWMEFLKEPYWYRIFRVEVNLRSLIKDAQKEKGGSWKAMYKSS